MPDTIHLCQACILQINRNLANSLTGILYGKSEFMRKSKEIVFM